MITGNNYLYVHIQHPFARTYEFTTPISRIPAQYYVAEEIDIFLRYTSSRTTGVDNVYLWCVLHAQRDAEYVRINNYFRLS